MEVKIITGTAEEIAALVTATRGRREVAFDGKRLAEAVIQEMEKSRQAE